MENRQEATRPASTNELTTTPEISMFQGGSVRSIMLDGQPWFVLTDICAALQLADPTTAARGLDQDERRKVRVATERGPRLTNVIDESGLYKLMFVSRKTEARRFCKWVTREVLPSLRRQAAGEAQEPLSGGRAYYSLPGPGSYRVTLCADGRLTADMIDPKQYIHEVYAPEVDSMALATCLVGTIWRQFQLFDAMGVLNKERSNVRYQLGEAIKQAHHIAATVMRTKAEQIDRPGD